MTKLDYWLWLSLKNNMGHNKITKLLEIFESPEEIYNTPKRKLLKTDGLSKEEIKELSNKSFKKVQSVKDECRKLGIRILTYDSSYYPEKLKHLPDPPYVLYVKSRERINLNDKLCIAVVGNRLMTDYGRGAAIDISKGLAVSGAVVVSGMARGIDGAAHTGALRVNGLTVAVLGCGLDIAYPPEHSEMMGAIAEAGMVISEYPPGTPPLAQNFPVRNRIISGLSDGVVVVEAPDKSGSLITADLALQQGRDVFAVPGDITRGHSKGTNDLIRQGAILATSAFDILSEYNEKYINLLTEHTNNSSLDNTEIDVEEKTFEFPNDGRYDSLSELSKKIVYNLTLTPVHFDTLLSKFDVSVDELTGELVMLEIDGFIKTLPGKNFILNI
ncbi:MAG: DNA-processing protein DprA [Clostridia bacterium]|nr:DNA-processing protein DprA [Clostridia bacterium]